MWEKAEISCATMQVVQAFYCLTAYNIQLLLNFFIHRDFCHNHLKITPERLNIETFTSDLASQQILN